MLSKKKKSREKWGVGAVSQKKVICALTSDSESRENKIVCYKNDCSQ
jgi:hypothetical protein